MDSTQTTIQLRPVYPRSHISLYNAPMLGAAMPNLTGLNIVNASNKQIITNGHSVNDNVSQFVNINSNQITDSNGTDNHNQNINNSATTPESTSSSILATTTLIPVNANDIRSTNLHLQPLRMHGNQHSQFFQTQAQAIAEEQKGGPCLQLQLQISTPTILNSSGATTVVGGNNSTSMNDNQFVASSNKSTSKDHPEFNCSLSNGSTASSSSMSASSAEATPQKTALNTIIGLTVKKDPPINNNVGSLVNLSGYNICINSSVDYRNMGVTGNNGIVNTQSSNRDSANSVQSTSGTSKSSSFSVSTNSSSSSSLTTSHSSRYYKCDICTREFTQKGNLKTHLMTHSGEKPYKCPTCDKTFTQKGNLDTHVKIHTETKDHRCDWCQRGFTQRGNLKTHIRSVHTKEKPFVCGQCGKSFAQKGNMLTHYRTHDKDARFPCDVCGKTFSQKGNLRTHQQRHGRTPSRAAH